MHGVPPPIIHVHIRIFDVAHDVPIGNLSTTPTLASSGRQNKPMVEVDIPEEEKEKFDVWLRELWQEKDQFITQFLEADSTDKQRAAVTIPLKLRRRREYLDAFCFFLPAAVGYVWGKIRG
jgi:hypothetical protein